MIVTVLYKYICFDLRATVGCFIASNLANLPQRLFLNATCGIQDISRHILATAHVKSQTQAEFELVWCLVLKAFAGRSGLVLMFVGKAGWHSLWGYRWTQGILKNYRWARNHKFSRQKCRNCAFSRQNSVCLRSSLSTRPFAMEELGSPVPALYAILGKSRLALIFTLCNCAVERAPVDGTNYELVKFWDVIDWPTPEMS